MMESLRNFLTGPRLFIVVAACALPFVFLGTSSLSSVFGGSLGTINGESVSELDFQVASNSTIQKFKSIYGDEFEFTDLDESFQMDQIKQELIIQKVLLSESKKLGLHGKNAEIQAKKSIIRNPLFQVDGVFNENVFEAQANANGFTKDNYINMLTDMIWCTNKITNKRCFRSFKKLFWCANLHDTTSINNNYVLRKSHGLVLIVSNIN